MLFGVPFTLVLSYAVLMAFLYFTRKNREVFRAERLPGMRPRPMEPVMTGYIVAALVFQAFFLVYFASESGIVQAGVLVVLAFLLSLVVQLVPIFLFRTLEGVVGLLTALGMVVMPLAAIGMIASLP